MKKKLLDILKYLLFLGLGVFLVWWSLHKIPDENWPAFKNALSTARYWIIVPVFFILVGSHLLRAYRWKLLMHPMGYKPSLINTFAAVMIGYLANLAVPRLGEVLKCTILARYEKVPADKLVGTIVAERAFDFIFLCIIFLLALALQYEIVAHYSTFLFSKLFSTDNGTLSVYKIITVISSILLVIILIREALKRYRDLSLVISIKRVLRGIWQGLVSVKHLEHKWPFVLSSVGIWTLYMGGTWLGFYGTLGTENLGPDVAVAALAFGSIGMIITPGGVGSYALFVSLILTKNNIPNEIALANGNLQWLAQFIIVLIIGFVALGLLPYINKNRISHAEHQHHTK